MPTAPRSTGQLPDALRHMPPMLLEQRAAPFDDADWAFEVKMDGYRLMACTGPVVALGTRGQVDATAWFPEVASSLSRLGQGLNVLDGEVCVLDGIGRSDFEKLHARARARRYRHDLPSVVYCVFDVLVHCGLDVRDLPLCWRQELLADLLAEPLPSILRVQSIHERGRWLYEQALALRLEGIVAKRLDSPYRCGERSPLWLKVKRPGATPAERFRREAAS